MRRRLIFFFVFVGICSLLNSTIWHIKLDGTGDFTTIQSGINAAVNSDTVLVYPGTYYENINYNGKNITVASLELMTGNPSYIPMTVINGQQQESCVKVMDQESSAKIQGFTITNGWGSQYYCRSGGAVSVIGEYQSPTYFSIKNCQITKNYSETGGGIYSFRGNISLSGVSIHDNYAYMSGGGIQINDTVLNFNDEKRCNIYDNLAGTGLDLYSFRCETNEVIVDTFTIREPTRYFANQYEINSCPNPPYSFDILNASIEQFNNDLYVSPSGNDANSGLTPNDPLKSIIQAIRKVVSDSLNPKTVHLAAGVYSKSANDQFFAFGGKDYVKISGDNETTTILDGEYGQYPLFYMGCSDNSVLMNMTLQNIQYDYFVVGFHDSNNTLFENVTVQNFEGTGGTAAIQSSPTESLYWKNVSIRNCSTPGFVSAVNLCEIKLLELDGCIIENNTCYGSGTNQMCAGLQASAYDDESDIIIKNTRFSNNTLDASASSNACALVIGTLNGESGDVIISNCLFENNKCLGTATKTVSISCTGEIKIINSTFADNYDSYTLSLGGQTEFCNNIMCDYGSYELQISGSFLEIDISYCDIAGGLNSINNPSCVNWLEGNIDEDPLFLLSGDDPYQLTDFSPCIDAGTPDTTGLFIPSWDLLHNQRVWDGDGNGVTTIDMGAYEFGAEPYVKSTPNLIPNIPYQITNYPNPFNPSTTISFHLPATNSVNAKLEIYNLKGQIVKSFDFVQDDNKEQYSIIWNGTDNLNRPVACGIYFARLKAGKFEASRKMLLIK